MCFVNRARDRGQGLTWRYWLDWVIVADVPRQRMLAQMARRGPCNERRCSRRRSSARHLTPPLTTMHCMVADAEFDSERNQPFIRQDFGALSVISANARASKRSVPRRSASYRHKPRAAQLRRNSNKRSCLVSPTTSTASVSPPCCSFASRMSTMPDGF